MTFNPDCKLGRHRFNPHHLSWENSPLIWVLLSAGGLDRDEEEGSSCVVPACSCLASKSISSRSLESGH